jgi:hypothetical protein
MLHEAIHAYMNYRNAFVRGQKHPEAVIHSLLQHDVMVSYVADLKASILEAYPSYPPDWAEAIAWGGLEKTASWSVMNSVAKQEILNKNWAERGNVASPLSRVGQACP